MAFIGRLGYVQRKSGQCPRRIKHPKVHYQKDLYPDRPDWLEEDPWGFEGMKRLSRPFSPHRHIVAAHVEPHGRMVHVSFTYAQL